MLYKLKDMIDAKKIVEAATKECKDIHNDNYKDCIKIGFYRGVEWFKETIWHNTTEQPIEFTPILVQWLNEGKIEYETDEHPQNFDWQRCFKENNVIKWCYLSDII